MSQWEHSGKWTDPENQGFKKRRHRNGKTLFKTRIYILYIHIHTHKFVELRLEKCLYGFKSEDCNPSVYRILVRGYQATSNHHILDYIPKTACSLNVLLLTYGIPLQHYSLHNPQYHHSTTANTTPSFTPCTTLNLVLVPRTIRMTTEYKIITVMFLHLSESFPCSEECHLKHSKCKPCWWMALDSGSGLAFDWAQFRRTFSSRLSRSRWNWRWT